MATEKSVGPAKKSAGKYGAAAKTPKPERRHVRSEVQRHMYRGLMVGAFLPGQVMSLRKLAEGMGTSPMPVREVLSRLVASKALEETSNGSVQVPRLSREKLADLFAVRERVEGMAAALAAKHVTPELIESLGAINDKLCTAIDKRDILACLSQNEQFHMTLYRAAESEVLMSLIESLWLRFGPTMYMSLLIPSMPWDAHAHRAILTALKAGDSVATERAITDDIRSTGAALDSAIGSDSNKLPFAQGMDLRFGA